MVPALVCLLVESKTPDQANLSAFQDISGNPEMRKMRFFGLERKNPNSD